MTEKRTAGRPQGRTMPCGWGCGAALTASSIREHFTTCPNRDKPDKVRMGLMAPNPYPTEMTVTQTMTRKEAAKRYPNTQLPPRAPAPRCMIPRLASAREEMPPNLSRSEVQRWLREHR